MAASPLREPTWTGDVPVDFRHKRDRVEEKLRELMISLDREIPDGYYGVVDLRFVFKYGRLCGIVRKLMTETFDMG